MRLRTNHAFFAYRVLNPERDTDLAEKLKIYPVSERDKPTSNEFFQAKSHDDTYFMAQPVGMGYWKRLHEYIHVARVEEADRYMLARLKAVGIEIGKPFEPTERQVAILEKAALVGEKMALRCRSQRVPVGRSIAKIADGCMLHCAPRSAERR